MTSRERFLGCLNYEPVDRVFVYPFWYWPETLERWRAEGWDGTPFEDLFDFDRLIWCGHLFFPFPPFEEKTIEEDQSTRTYINHEGIVMKEFKEHRFTSMPQFIRFPVETREDFHRFVAERLQPNLMERMGKNADETFKAWCERTAPLIIISDRWGGFFGALRNLTGVERLCMLFHDDPRFVEEMMDTIVDFIIQMMDQILDHTDIDMYGFWEDMAYKTAPLISPAMVRRFMLPRYRRVVNHLRSRGVKWISLDSDGDINSLLPIWVEAGINFLYPFENQSGMDVVQVRRQYGKELRMLGNIDKKAIAAGPKAIDAEFERVRPVLREGGYIPMPDHSCPPDISWKNICYFTERLHEECKAAGRA